MLNHATVKMVLNAHLDTVQQEILVSQTVMQHNQQEPLMILDAIVNQLAIAHHPPAQTTFVNPPVVESIT